jgi:TetR/AcrR family transcriptional repressor of nem operon
VRYPPEHKAESRARIVGAAAELFRSGGIGNTGLDAVMARAGLTSGAFYAHFDSKQALVEEAVLLAGQLSVEKWFGRFQHLRGRAWVRELLRTYLGPDHRRDLSGGCILPSLGPEVGRQPLEVRKHFSRRLQGFFDLVGARANGELSLEREQVIAAVALAVPEASFQDEISRAARKSASELLGLARRRGRPSRRTTGSLPKKRRSKGEVKV